MTKAIYTSHWN